MLLLNQIVGGCWWLIMTIGTSPGEGYNSIEDALYASFKRHEASGKLFRDKVIYSRETNQGTVYRVLDRFDYTANPKKLKALGFHKMSLLEIVKAVDTAFAENDLTLTKPSKQQSSFDISELLQHLSSTKAGYYKGEGTGKIKKITTVFAKARQFFSILGNVVSTSPTRGTSSDYANRLAVKIAAEQKAQESQPLKIKMSTEDASVFFNTLTASVTRKLKLQTSESDLTFLRTFSRHVERVEEAVKNTPYFASSDESEYSFTLSREADNIVVEFEKPKDAEVVNDKINWPNIKRAIESSHHEFLRNPSKFVQDNSPNPADE